MHKKVLIKKKFKNENEKKTLVIIDDYNILTRKGKQRKKEYPYKGEVFFLKKKNKLAQLIKNIGKIA